METVFHHICKNIHISFKSYYVVWKRFFVMMSCMDIFGFKSYYVVWKPQAPPAPFPRQSLFKSYYVVWKLKRMESKERERGRLNRTMQYGNRKIVGRLFPQLCLFKSYYVVWKPFSWIFSPRALYSFKSYYVVWKLENRAEEISSGIQFKSYYVVWKLKYERKQNGAKIRLNRTMQYGNENSLKTPSPAVYV